jgi:hypothetical protein
LRNNRRVTFRGLAFRLPARGARDLVPFDHPQSVKEG